MRGKDYRICGTCGKEYDALKGPCRNCGGNCQHTGARELSADGKTEYCATCGKAVAERPRR